MPALKHSFALLILITLCNDSYCMELWVGNHKQKIESSLLEEKYPLLNNEPEYYDPTFFKRNRIWQENILIKEKAQHIKLSTWDGHTISGCFLDRGSDTVIVIGQGFKSLKEQLIPFFKIFPQYDILIIDYRWLPWNQNLWNHKSLLYNALKNYIFDARYDVYAAVTFLKTLSHKKYKAIVGLGICYSALIYTIAQAEKLKEGDKLFDKLILDSSYNSMYTLACQAITEPIVCFGNNKQSRTPAWLRTALSTFPVRWGILGLGYILMGRDFTKLSMQNHLPLIKDTPLLFFHGTQDILASYSNFQAIYQTASHTPCYAIITPAQHTSNHLNNKELYAYAVTKFIESKAQLDNGL